MKNENSFAEYAHIFILLISLVLAIFLFNINAKLNDGVKNDPSVFCYMPSYYVPGIENINTADTILTKQAKTSSFNQI